MKKSITLAMAALFFVFSFLLVIRAYAQDEDSYGGEVYMAPTPEQQQALNYDNYGGEVYMAPTPQQTNALYSEYNIEPFGGEGFGENPLAGPPGTGSGTGAGGGTGGGGGGDTGTGVTIDINNQQKLPDGGYGFMGSDNNLWKVQNDQWVQILGAGAAGQTYTNAGLTSPSGQDLVRNSSGQLYQASGGQMVPYTGDLSQTYTNAGLTSPSGQDLVRNSSGQLYQASGGQMVPYTGDLSQTYTNAGLTSPSGQNLVRNESGQLMQIGANNQMVPYTGDISQTYTNAGLTSPSGQNLVRNSNGQLMQIGANGQMVPYTGSTVVDNSGYTSTSGGIGDFVSSIGSGIGNYIGSLFGGGGSSGTSMGGYTGGYGGSSGIGGFTGSGGGIGLAGYGGGGNGIALPTGMGLPSGTISGVLTTFLKWLLGIFGLIAIISFLISGIMYFTAAGNKEDAEKAKKQMEWSILGVIIGLGGLIIVNAVTTWFSGNSMF